MDEDWEVLLSFLAQDWRELARDTGALKGLRKDEAVDNLLRTLLLHLGCGHSLRERVVRARQAQLADLSDVALLKRFEAVERGAEAGRAAPHRLGGVPDLPAHCHVVRRAGSTTAVSPRSGACGRAGSGA